MIPTYRFIALLFCTNCILAAAESLNHMPTINTVKKEISAKLDQCTAALMFIQTAGISAKTTTERVRYQDYLKANVKLIKDIKQRSSLAQAPLPDLLALLQVTQAKHEELLKAEEDSSFCARPRTKSTTEFDN